MTPGFLPTLNAILNATATVFLIVGYRFIRQKNIQAHQRAMVGAFAISSIFLVSYLIHHYEVGSVPFKGVGPLRTLYFTILIPHVILAIVLVPLALLTIYRGWTNKVERHRAVARFTLPIWLYVSVSGVLVYLMLYQL